MQNFNPSAQPFIPAGEAQQNPVPNTQEPRIPKSANGQGVKSSSTTQGVFPMQATRTPKERLPSCHTAPNVKPRATSL